MPYLTQLGKISQTLAHLPEKISNLARDTLTCLGGSSVKNHFSLPCLVGITLLPKEGIFSFPEGAWSTVGWFSACIK